MENCKGGEVRGIEEVEEKSEERGWAEGEIKKWKMEKGDISIDWKGEGGKTEARRRVGRGEG